MNILMIKSNQNIRLRNKKNKKKENKIWESVLNVAGTIAAIVLAGVQKILIWKKKNAIKVLEILRKVRDNLKELLKVPANMADICKISRYWDSRYLEFFALMKC